MRHIGTAVLAAILATALPGSAQDDAPRGQQRFGPQEANEALEFEVVSVMRQDLVVVARDVESGDEFRFRFPAQTFQGQEFTADFGTASPGRKISVKGEPNAKLEKLVLEAPLGLSRSRDAGARPPGYGRRPDYGSAPPGASNEPPRRPGARSDRYGFGTRNSEPGGETKYRVENFDPRQWIVTARGSDGSKIRLEVDPEAFVGFRFRAPVRDLRRGEGFAMLALNQTPLENCCTVVPDGGSR